ncbi:PfkB family carbohydrate kinase [Paenibacillus paeoniae]|uniref:PfkB family carbohydrate kinase n=1 Tax=Paenibacillus paeoniae TaxID=2292705 RepID=UPI0014029BF5|nr:PfkB family carbohydrate kinase [Paenibacillus paeoniae]
MKHDVICIGELLIDFVSSQSEASLIDSPGFIKAPGGAPANVAVGLSRLGRRSSFIGKVGRDPFGQFLTQTLHENQVDISEVIYDEDARTTLSFVAIRLDGIRDCMFYRNPGADILLRADEISDEYLGNSKVLHFGSVSLSHEPSRSATLHAVKRAKELGLLVSYDPNLRLMLWDDEEEAKREIQAAFSYADIVKISEEEMAFITGYQSEVAAANYILSKGAQLVVISRGERGCFYSDGAVTGEIEGHRIAVKETTGAGDAFVAGLLSQLLIQHDRDGQFHLKVDSNLVRAIQFANAAGALATTKIGAIPSMPTTEEVYELLQSKEL